MKQIPSPQVSEILELTTETIAKLIKRGEMLGEKLKHGKTCAWHVTPKEMHRYAVAKRDHWEMSRNGQMQYWHWRRIVVRIEGRYRRYLD